MLLCAPLAWKYRLKYSEQLRPVGRRFVWGFFRSQLVQYGTRHGHFRPEARVRARCHNSISMR